MIYIKKDNDDIIKNGLNIYSLDNKNSFGFILAWKWKNYRYAYWVRRTKINGKFVVPFYRWWSFQFCKAESND